MSKYQAPSPQSSQQTGQQPKQQSGGQIGGRRPAPAKSQPNPGGQARPAFQPSGGRQTPASATTGSGGGGGRKPDYEVFFAEEQTDENGKRFFRVRTYEREGRTFWDKCGAIWLAEGKNPLIKFDCAIPAGAQLTCRPANRNPER